MVHALGRSWFATAFATLVLATACNDPQGPKPEAILEPLDQGTFDVSVTTSGSDIDPDGYIVWVDDSQSQAIATNGTVAFTGLVRSDHVIALYGVASNCTVAYPNPRTGHTAIGVVGTTAFVVSCVSEGGLYVSTTTTGVDLDADGYAVTVDGRASQAIATNGSVTFTALAAGAHSVALSGAAGNCSLSGSNPQTVSVRSGATTASSFSLSCTPTGSGSGTLTVTTTTTGSNPDPDGYTVTIDGTFSQPIATNGSVTVTGPAGDHPVTLSGVAANCTVSEANPRTVTVPAGGTGTTTFSLTCSALQPPAEMIGHGQIGMGSPTPGNNVQTFDLDVRADLTGRFTATDFGDIHGTTPANLTTDHSADPATSITAYRNSSNACSDPSRGVEFDGVGREDQGGLVSYTVKVCDNGPPGSGTDVLSLYIPSEGYGRSGIVTSGDNVKN